LEGHTLEEKFRKTDAVIDIRRRVGWKIKCSAENMSIYY
jgi:hypothetical protein